MERKRQDEQPAGPELFIEKAALGEATVAQAQRLPAAESPQGQAQLQALRESNAAILARYPAAPFAAQVMQRATAEQAPARRPLRRLLPLGALPLLGAAGLLALFLMGRTQPGPGPTGDPQAQGDDDGVVRTKGQRPLLLLYRQESGPPQQLADGALGRAGDLLQLGYVAAGQPNGALLSIDGRGGVTLHFPAAVDGATALHQRGVTLLDRSFRLDDAPHFERFFFVTASDGRTLSLAAVLDSARQLAQRGDAARSQPLPLPPSLHQTSLLLHKP